VNVPISHSDETQKYVEARPVGLVSAKQIKTPPPPQRERSEAQGEARCTLQPLSRGSVPPEAAH